LLRADERAAPAIPCNRGGGRVFQEHEIERGRRAMIRGAPGGAAGSGHEGARRLARPREGPVTVRDDAGLTAALAADLPASFERAVLAFQDRLYAFALRLTGSAPDAEEITQDAFVRAYRALQGYAPERRRALALRPWLYRIALNVTRNHVRRRRLPTEPLDGDRLQPAADAADRPPAVLEQAERARTLARLVEALPERYRAAVVLRHVEGLGYEEIAAVLGQPVGTAKANVHRGLAVLRRGLEADGRKEATR
jgi:RNA polymerase sigma-70 factor (ECF subfamily)